MKGRWFKAMVGKLAATAALLLFLVLVPAVAAGSISLWAAVLLGLGGVLALNGACGVLLQGEARQQPVPAPVPARQIPLRVVRGGRAA